MNSRSEDHAFINSPGKFHPREISHARVRIYPSIISGMAINPSFYKSSQMLLHITDDVSVISGKPADSPSHYASVVKTFQKCNLQSLNFVSVSEKSFKLFRFKFYLIKFTNKIFPIWCNVNFEPVFTAINNTKSKENRLKLTPYGEIFYLLT